MNVEKIEKMEYEAYERLINIELFNEIISFIANTRSSKDTLDIFQKIEKKCIWINQTYSYAIQEKYKFQYFGELLERYDERIENNIKNIRAIALALGYARKLVENNMIMGTQLVDFLNKIEHLSENDVYLKGALYLCDNKKYYMYSEELMNKKYTKTEEIIFALSIFYEKIDDFFKQNRTQIINLVGNARNISVMGNMGIYAWLIRNLYPLIYKDRKKDISLLKALIKVPTGFQKEDTTVYKELINNGYSKEEIIYLNYLVLYYNTVPNSVRLEKSIVEEKIATNLCIILINSESSYEKNVYDLIKNVLYKYNEFEIKCYGYVRIKDAIKDKINVINPITFSELYYELGNNLYSFDILDEKWDVVATKTDSKEYQEIFDYFLLYSNCNKDKINKCINKYNKLTNKQYIESFLEYNYNRKSIFEFLVNKNVILLRDVFEYILKANKQNQNNHLKDYIEGINNKKSFEFLKYLLRLNKYSIAEISEFGFHFEKLIMGYLYSSHPIYSLDIERKFLDIKGSRILFNCLENFVFYNQPKKYFRFLEAALKSNIMCRLFKKEELRQLYLSLSKIMPEVYEHEWLQEKYLTSEEINTIREQKRKEQELRESQEVFEAENFIKEKFNDIVDKNSFENLYRFCDKYEYSSDIKLKFSINLTKKYILENINMFKKEKQEIMYFMQILKFFMKKEELTPAEFIKITHEYIKEEVQKNESINESCQFSN